MLTQRSNAKTMCSYVECSAIMRKKSKEQINWSGSGMLDDGVFASIRRASRCRPVQTVTLPERGGADVLFGSRMILLGYDGIAVSSENSAFACRSETMAWAL
jgi:hypothetical protein